MLSTRIGYPSAAEICCPLLVAGRSAVIRLAGSDTRTERGEEPVRHVPMAFDREMGAVGEAECAIPPVQDVHELEAMRARGTYERPVQRRAHQAVRGSSKLRGGSHDLREDGPPRRGSRCAG